jgi:hypothetical protein
MSKVSRVLTPRSTVRMLLPAFATFALLGSVRAAVPSHAPLLTPDQKRVDLAALALLHDPGVEAAREAGLKRWAGLPQSKLKDGNRTLESALNEAVYFAVRAVAAYNPYQPAVIWTEAPPYSYGNIKVPGSRFAGDSPDRIYREIAVDASHRYEIHGQRRAVPSNEDFSFEALPSISIVGQPLSALKAKDIDIAPDGSFTITADPSPANGRRNHLTLPPGTKVVLVRDTLADWSAQLPNELTVKRIDAAPVAVRTAAEVQRQAAQEVTNAIEANIRFLGAVTSAPVNRPKAQIRRPQDGVAGAIIASSGFSIGPDEALVVTIDPQGAKYVGFQVTDPWFRSRPYWRATGSLSNRQAKGNADGSLTYVIAAREPGYYNWLDSGGLHHGFLLVRVEDFGQTPDPAKVVREARLVRLAQLAAGLAVDPVRTTPAERARQLAVRHAGYVKRLAR